MAGNPQPPRMVGFTRIIEYYGPEDWIQRVVAASKVPLQGELVIPESPTVPGGAVIRSGLVNWNVEEPAEQPPAPAPPTPIRLPRPGTGGTN